MELKGVVGRVEWYVGDVLSSSAYVAGAIEGYTVTADKTLIWRLTGRLVNSDAFKLAQRPLRFVAPHAKGCWYWPMQSCVVADGQLTALLGQPRSVTKEETRAVRET